MYTVARDLNYPGAVDYLMAIVPVEDWGTACVGTACLFFPTLNDARSAARKARRVCMGWNHRTQRRYRARLIFRAVPV